MHRYPHDSIKRPPPVPRLAALLAGAAGALGLAAPADAQFASAFAVAAASQPDSVAVGDWDGDTDMDLAIPLDAPDRVVFLYNDGDEAFGTPTEVMTGDGSSPHTAAVADFDGDGDLDVAVSLQGSNVVRVLVNNGAGAFALGTETVTGTEPRVLRVADFNGGAPDLLSVNRAGSSVTVLLNDGGGAFTPSTMLTSPDPRDADVGDLNGDGDVDFAVSVHDNRRVELFANTGTGAFLAAGALLLGSQVRPDGVAVANIDGDSDLDLAVSASGNGLDVAVVFANVGPGTGAGAFAAPISFPLVGLNPSRIVDGDFNEDGDPDLATANADSDNVSVLFGDGKGNYSGPELFAVGDQPVALLAADLDGNGGDDLLTAEDLGNTVSVLLNLNGDTVFFAVPDSGLAGTLGIPLLLGDSTLEPGTPASLELSAAKPNAAAGIVIGLSQMNFPFKGGVLVPDDDFIIALPTSTIGTLGISGTVPAGLPQGTDIFIQVIVADAVAIQGFALSNAIHGITP
jgi:hypothetical protein